MHKWCGYVSELDKLFSLRWSTWICCAYLLFSVHWSIRPQIFSKKRGNEWKVILFCHWSSFHLLCCGLFFFLGGGEFLVHNLLPFITQACKGGTDLCISPRTVVLAFFLSSWAYAICLPSVFLFLSNRRLSDTSWWWLWSSTGATCCYVKRTWYVSFATIRRGKPAPSLICSWLNMVKAIVISSSWHGATTYKDNV